ncbi:type II toxin-antitoxin system PemK/MazF family toxin [Gimesia panareensis]|uniref:type II toxin-antitoxin system PemK/MazF family toxin n=1 Tax=Gimesia panareensis TaxID=2527978 RepID=UPI00118D079E|nr:type II toxin-antitoxin system PemK/MazF family toxin [Gimesia panareensis]QDU52962.1 mRNA interferase EndoA [Gimesia panareensis]
MKRGEIVLIDFPYTDGRSSKLRPALVVQNDVDNARLRDTIVAMITGNIRHAQEQTHFLVDPTTPDGASSGLHGPSCVLGRHLFTVRQTLITRTLGSLSDEVMQQVDDALKAALGL